MMSNRCKSKKRELVFGKLLDGSISIRWCIKSSIIPFVGKLMPNDDIEIVKTGNRVQIRFSVHNVKKFTYSRRNTIIVFDFGQA